MSTDKKRTSKILKRLDPDTNSFLNHPFITIQDRRIRLGNPYDQAIEIGLKNQFLKLLHKTDKFVKNNFKFNKNFEKEHYRSASMADMAKGDEGNIQKKLMDFFWGEPSDKQKKEAEKIMQELYYTR